MTKVTLHYPLLRPLTDADFDNVARLHGHYGMARVVVAPGRDQITVDYDASRLMRKDVDSVLALYGMPIQVPQAA